MITETEFFNYDAFNAPVRGFGIKVELLNGGSTVDAYRGSDRVKSLAVDRSGVKGKYIGYGICQKLTLELLDKDRELNITQDNSFKGYFTAAENSAELCPFPVFNVPVDGVKRDENSNALTITAYDALYKASSFKVSDLSLSPPYTLGEFLDACGALLGVDVTLISASANYTDELTSSVYEQGANFDGTETVRAALDAAAEVLLSIYYIDCNNMLVFKCLDKEGAAALTIDKSGYFTLKTQAVSILSDITHTTELGDNITASSGIEGATQYFRDNPFLELREDAAAVLDAAVEVIGGLSLAPFSLEWRGNFLLELGDKIQVTTKDNSSITTYFLSDTIRYDGGIKQVTSWELDTSSAETESNPTKLGEALNKTFAKVDKAEKRINLLVSEVDATKDSVSSLQLEAESITASVSKLEKEQNEALTGVNDELAELNKKVEATITAEDVKIEIKTELANGVDKVTTSKGFTFDDEGLTVEKEGSEVKTVVNEDGMRVFKADELMLSADNTGVKAQNLHATTYLIIGNNSRFEDYTTAAGDIRTGCFWIGG